MIVIVIVTGFCLLHVRPGKNNSNRTFETERVDLRSLFKRNSMVNLLTKISVS